MARLLKHYMAFEKAAPGTFPPLIFDNPATMPVDVNVNPEIQGSFTGVEIQQLAEATHNFFQENQDLYTSRISTPSASLRAIAQAIMNRPIPVGGWEIAKYLPAILGEKSLRGVDALSEIYTFPSGKKANMPYVYNPEIFGYTVAVPLDSLAPEKILNLAKCFERRQEPFMSFIELEKAPPISIEPIQTANTKMRAFASFDALHLSFDYVSTHQETLERVRTFIETLEKLLKQMGKWDEYRAAEKIEGILLNQDKKETERNIDALFQTNDGSFYFQSLVNQRTPSSVELTYSEQKYLHLRATQNTAKTPNNNLKETYLSQLSELTRKYTDPIARRNQKLSSLKGLYESMKQRNEVAGEILLKTQALWMRQFQSIKSAMKPIFQETSAYHISNTVYDQQAKVQNRRDNSSQIFATCVTESDGIVWYITPDGKEWLVQYPQDIITKGLDEGKRLEAEARMRLGSVVRGARQAIRQSRV